MPLLKAHYGNSSCVHRNGRSQAMSVSAIACCQTNIKCKFWPCIWLFVFVPSTKYSRPLSDAVAKHSSEPKQVMLSHQVANKRTHHDMTTGSSTASKGIEPAPLNLKSEEHTLHLIMYPSGQSQSTAGLLCPSTTALLFPHDTIVTRGCK